VPRSPSERQHSKFAIELAWALFGDRAHVAIMRGVLRELSPSFAALSAKLGQSHLIISFTARTNSKIANPLRSIAVGILEASLAPNGAATMLPVLSPKKAGRNR
jgi:hypothetical protein